MHPFPRLLKYAGNQRRRGSFALGAGDADNVPGRADTEEFIGHGGDFGFVQFRIGSQYCIRVQPGSAEYYIELLQILEIPVTQLSLDSTRHLELRILITHSDLYRVLSCFFIILRTTHSVLLYIPERRPSFFRETDDRHLHRLSRCLV